MNLLHFLDPDRNWRSLDKVEHAAFGFGICLMATGFMSGLAAFGFTGPLFNVGNDLRLFLLEILFAADGRTATHGDRRSKEHPEGSRGASEEPR